MSEPNKKDEGKEDWSLLPPIALRPVIRVLQFGATKYGRHNYAEEQGILWSRFYAAALRHLTSWYEGEDKDSESGELHLAHACCCIIMLLIYQQITKFKTNDDRPATLLKGKENDGIASRSN